MRWGVFAGLVVLSLGMAAQAAPVTPAVPGNTTSPSIERVASVFSQAVASVQQQLAAAGYYTGTVDGINGPMTKAAVRAYQADHGLPVTGDVYALASVFGGAPVATTQQNIVVPRQVVVPPAVIYPPVRPTVRLFVGPRIGWGYRWGGWGWHGHHGWRR